MILTRTPLRVSLFGGGTDYPAFFKENGGAVLGMAIDKFAYVGVKHMPPGQTMKRLDGAEVPIKFRVQYSKVDDVALAEEIRHPAVKAAVSYYELEKEALEFHCFGDLPGRSGLGGSGAFTVGLCHALHKLFSLGMGGMYDAWSIADDAIHIEQEVIKEAVGCQDQVFAAHGGINLITFEKHSRVVRPLDLPFERIEELAFSLVLVFSGTMRDAHVMAEKTIEAIPYKGKALQRMKEQAWSAYDLLLNGGKIATLGGILNEAWELKKSVTPEVSTPEIDALYEQGLSFGATGGKLLGAGGGGFFLFFVPVDRHDDFLSSMHREGKRTTTFRASPQGSTTIIEEKWTRTPSPSSPGCCGRRCLSTA